MGAGTGSPTGSAPDAAWASPHSSRGSRPGSSTRWPPGSQAPPNLSCLTCRTGRLPATARHEEARRAGPGQPWLRLGGSHAGRAPASGQRRGGRLTALHRHSLSRAERVCRVSLYGHGLCTLLISAPAGAGEQAGPQDPRLWSGNATASRTWEKAELDGSQGDAVQVVWRLGVPRGWRWELSSPRKGREVHRLGPIKGGSQRTGPQRTEPLGDELGPRSPWAPLTSQGDIRAAQDRGCAIWA